MRTARCLPSGPPLDRNSLDPGQRPPLDRDPPPCGQTDTCEYITLPQTSFAGGKNKSNQIKFCSRVAMCLCKPVSAYERFTVKTVNF